MGSSIASFVEFLKRSPEGAALVAREAEQAFEARRRLVVQLGKVRKNRAPLEQATAEAETARATHERAAAEAQKALEARRQAEARVNVARLEFDNAIARIEAELRGSAPPELAEEVQRLRDEAESLVPRLDFRVRVDGLFSRREVLSSYNSVNARRGALVRAAREVEDLALEALTPPDVKARIRDIRRTLEAYPVHFEDVSGGAA